MSFKGIKAFITGASSGLGYALAASLIEGGADFVLVTGRNEKALHDLVDLGEKQGVEVVSCVLDLNAVDAQDALETLFHEISLKHKLNLVIACAGVSTTASEDKLEDLFEIERSINVNVKGAVSTLYLGAQALKAHGEGGHLVVISSLASLVTLPSSALYGASKTYLNAYAKALSEEVKDFKIKVTTVFPGFIDTPMSKRFIGRHDGMITASKAAYKILKGALKGKRRVIFPYYLYFGIMLSKLLPLPLQTLVLKLFDFKVIQDPERKAYEQSLISSEKFIEATAKDSQVVETSVQAKVLPKTANIDEAQEQNLQRQSSQTELKNVSKNTEQESLASREVKTVVAQKSTSLRKVSNPLKKVSKDTPLKRVKPQKLTAKAKLNSAQMRAEKRKSDTLLDKTLANDLHSEDTEIVIKGEDLEGGVGKEDVYASRAKKRKLASLTQSKNLKAYRAQELHLALESNSNPKEFVEKRLQTNSTQTQKSVSKLKSRAQGVSLKDNRNLQKLAKTSLNAQNSITGNLRPDVKASSLVEDAKQQVRASRPVGLVVSTNLQRSGYYQRRGLK